MLLCRVVAASVLAILITAVPAAAATAAAGPSPAPLLFEIALGILVVMGLAARGAARRPLAPCVAGSPPSGRAAVAPRRRR